MSVEKIEQTIRSCRNVEEELSFHAQRLENTVKPETESEQEHIINLAKEYRNAARVVGVMRRYQEGRLRRERQRSGTNGAEVGPFIDETL